MIEPRLSRFLATIAEADRSPALSDAKVGQLGNPSRYTTIEERDEIVGVAVAARHAHGDGSHHWAIESALLAGMRFAEFEDRLLESALQLVPATESVSVWSHRHSLDDALARNGFSVSRELALYRVDLPIVAKTTGLEVRSFEPDDMTDVLAINRAAFSEHREAAVLDVDTFTSLVSQPWFDPAGFLLAVHDGSIEGFCWTRVHDSGEGEIYRIAVSPHAQGRGVGRALVLAGFGYLANRTEVRGGTLWVDLTNTSAVAMYERIGMRQSMVNREFETSSDG